ncbi:MAG: glutamate-1-semialdehyde 2,1-aminomutase [Lachnospiraceae bacterium]|nr:glutamate-1-semialdehyde 2,1-aminomutase [Lachnospiraceae bacterium]
MTRSEELFEEAKKYIPGGVNSPVRAFGSIGSTPRFIRSGSGGHMTDEDGLEYVDFIGSWGPMLLGHDREEVRESVLDAVSRGLSSGAATEIEVRMARLICEMVPSIEMVRMVNSGTEAVMSAIRVARGFTGRDKIVKFDGCYHGHSDGLLVRAGSGVMTAGAPGSLGVPAGCTADTLTARYNDLANVEALFAENPGQIAAVIVEPVAANMGVVLPEEGFLPGLRELCTKHGALLIFDEVITGFRLGSDGAQGWFGVTPDLTTFGKIIGAGMPVGAYGGRREIMELVAPLGGVYQAGTLSGNPVAMAAGYTQLSLMQKHPEWYEELNAKADCFFTSMQEILTRCGKPYQVSHLGSLGCLFFTAETVRDYDSAKTSDTAAFARYCNFMLNHGIYLAPAQFEAIFLSAAHTEKDLAKYLGLLEEYMENSAR